ncbi:hypothetical protein [Brevibacillus sp. H7]|jgi:hypothetical protein|uniref:hypothetical protein n=1 Tax=Brevibacillus sp. H7 TaxID=3349138 RepID=UPI003800CC85
MKPQETKRSVVVWETRPRRDGNVIPLPAKSRGEGWTEQEETVTEWTVGTEEQSAKVTMVSSGFGDVKPASPKPVSMRLAA